MGIVSRLIQLIYPPRCTYCGEVVPRGIECCSSCEKEIRPIKPPLCKVCGAREFECGYRRHTYNFMRCVAPFYYEGPVQKAIIRLKVKGRKDGAACLAGEMAEVVRREYKWLELDYIVPVPMSKDELKARGFNQSLLLSQHLSKLLDIELLENCLCKVRNTKPQHSLNFAQRSVNLENAFEVKEPEKIRDKRILLCDDIMTSGATLNECAGVLKKSGAKQVYCVVLAKTKIKIQK